jgi:HAD superfamily hydrolase (TIGR01509 family)
VNDASGEVVENRGQPNDYCDRLRYLMINLAPPIRLPDRWPRAVVFDMDGLMFDSERVDREIWREVVRGRGHEFPDTLHDSLVGRSQMESDRLLGAHFGGEFPLPEVRAEVQARWEERIAAEGLPHKPGLVELLEFLEAVEMPTAVATSTERSKALLCLGSFAPRFRALAFGSEVSHPKPAPDLYLLAADRLGIDPRDCLALEDSPVGLSAAQAADMTVILVPDLIAPAIPPPFICRTLTDVTEWLRRLGADRAGKVADLRSRLP